MDRAHALREDVQPNFQDDFGRAARQQTQQTQRPRPSPCTTLTSPTWFSSSVLVAHTAKLEWCRHARDRKSRDNATEDSAWGVPAPVDETTAESSAALSLLLRS